MSSTGGSKQSFNVEEEENNEQIHSEQSPGIRLKRHDSLDLESAKISGHHGHQDTKDWRVILRLAFQSIGVVYGDIGGTFALYSKLCRYVKVGLSEQPEDREVSNFQLELPGKGNKIASKVKKSLERSNFAKFALLFAAMLGTSMVIGLKEATNTMKEGTEAMFADLGHFTVKSIQISMGCVVYPALITAYSGQASWLRKHKDLVADTFYKSTPDALYWPMFVVAVMAAIIASQAMISGTFSIIKQSLSLGIHGRDHARHMENQYTSRDLICACD
ncbi:hypothetical protein L1987_13093 [Smallanthus sonchifolius]|uniref:Uncharacterized protein n=1 Tax=Smallanthus sonchifolius TaxID=185202 RepID=A0ACB9JJ25_9ASTR|nr:hypothetical protein L1987_13093 [Smallanthus sonchifolius]